MLILICKLFLSFVLFAFIAEGHGRAKTFKAEHPESIFAKIIFGFSAFMAVMFSVVIGFLIWFTPAIETLIYSV